MHPAAIGRNETIDELIKEITGAKWDINGVHPQWIDGVVKLIINRFEQMKTNGAVDDERG